MISENPEVSIRLVDLKSFDDRIFQHSVSVCILAVVLGKSLKQPLKNLEDLALGALLHDLGMMLLPPPIRKNQGKLTLAEMNLFKTHPREGFNLLGRFANISAQAKAFVLQHHERYNGSGYPKELSGIDIHLGARIGGLVDAYDDLVSDHPHRSRLLPHQALAVIKEGTGRLFDPDVAAHFLRIVSPYPIGSRLLLSSGEEVSVIRVAAGFLASPIVQVVSDAKGLKPDRTVLIDLASDPRFRIEKVLG
ncbi:MAG TPA: hypothetical protein DD435_15415 [Cyanobacteria bacterium UBA8530]|nr:hypothetical protein [Cyanobacteria bacterium UBA8530]